MKIENDILKIEFEFDPEYCHKCFNCWWNGEVDPCKHKCICIANEEGEPCFEDFFVYCPGLIAVLKDVLRDIDNLDEVLSPAIEKLYNLKYHTWLDEDKLTEMIINYWFFGG